MTRKLSLIFTFSTIIIYFVLLGLIGEEGFLHARSVRQELEVLRHRQDELLLQVDSLEQQKKLMSSQDALKDAAFRFGYQMEGEQVFYFAEGGEGDHPTLGEVEPSPMKGQPFKGFAKSWVALFALAFSTLFTILWGIWAKRRESRR